jgi:hypothetical protein
MRLFEVLVNGQTFISESKGTQFKIVFNVSIDFGGFNTYMDLSIYNLSNESEALLLTKDTTIALRAGYDDTIDTIFNGKIFNAFKDRQGPSTLIRIIARGGTSFDKKTVNLTLGDNAPVIDVIKASAEATGYPIVIDDSQFSDVAPYTRGFVLSGDPWLKLDNLAQLHNFSYVIDNDSIVIVHKDSFRIGEPVEVSERTGMEGIPEISEVGCNVTTRLNPKLKIGGRIDIKSQFRTITFSNVYYVDVPASAGVGVYRIFKLEYSGDSWGNDWSTRITSVR